MEQIIQNYINKITKKDIENFAISNEIFLTEKELAVLFMTLKEDWKELLYGDPEKILQDLKMKLEPNTYQKGIELFYKMKKKYQSFL